MNNHGHLEHYDKIMFTIKKETDAKGGISMFDLWNILNPEVVTDKIMVRGIEIKEALRYAERSGFITISGLPKKAGEIGYFRHDRIIKAVSG